MRTPEENGSDVRSEPAPSATAQPATEANGTAIRAVAKAPPMAPDDLVELIGRVQAERRAQNLQDVVRRLFEVDG